MPTYVEPLTADDHRKRGAIQDGEHISFNIMMMDSRAASQSALAARDSARAAYIERTTGQPAPAAPVAISDAQSVRASARDQYIRSITAR